MLDDIPWFCDPYIFYLTSRTLSLVWFDQIFNLLFLFYLISILITRGQYLSNSNPWFIFINPINFSAWGNLAWDSYLGYVNHLFIGVLTLSFSINLFLSWCVLIYRSHTWVVLWSQIDLTLQLHSLTTCVPIKLTHYLWRGKCMHSKMVT